MSHRSLVATALLTVLPALPLVAQGTAKQAVIGSDVRAQLWPTRELSEVKQVLKDQIVAMRDTLTVLSATIEQTDRARRSRNTPAVLISRTRTLSSDCARVERNATSFAEFAATLETDDTRFGQPSVKRFQAALAKLFATASHCRIESDRLAQSPETLVPDQVLLVLNATRPVIDEYSQAAKALAQTLRLQIEATDRS